MVFKCLKILCNSSNSSWDTTLKTSNIKLLDDLEEKYCGSLVTGFEYYPITHSNNLVSVIVLERHIKVPLSLSVLFFLMDCISYQKMMSTEKYALPNKSIFNYNSTIAHQVENNYQVGNNQ